MSAQPEPLVATTTRKTLLQRTAAYLRLILPHLPHVLLHSATHLLSLSQQAAYWDLKATVIVGFCRSYLQIPSSREPRTVEAVQAETNRRQKAAADTWCAEVTYAASQGFNAEKAVHDAIVALGGNELAVLKVGFEQLRGEWVTARSRPLDGPAQSQSAQETYEALLADIPEKESVILWLHGGAYWLCSPSTHRPMMVNHSRSSRTRVFVPEYRLAPQHPFPAALIDALLSYLYLLHPPPGAFHTPIAPEKLVVAGDSAGGGLSLAIIQLLLQLHRSQTTIHWHGQDIQVPLPAGVATLSSWCDVSRCFGRLSDFPNGSEETCHTYDYLPTAHGSAEIVHLSSPAWNLDLQKQRGSTQFYAPDVLVTHPFVSPMLAGSWAGAPPMWIAVGDEYLRDQNLFLGHRLLEDGVKLRFEKYTAMPHVFQGLLSHLKVSQRAWDSLGRFVNHVTGASDAGKGLWGRIRMHPKTLEEEEVGMEELKVGGLELEQVKGMVRKAVVRFAELARKPGGEEMDIGTGASGAVALSKI
jgi:acetyl esterase/lipase